MEKRSFTTKVIFSDGNRVAFKNTLFYPEGGGQLADIGTITWGNQTSKVVDVKKVGDVILHHLDGKAPSKGTEIKELLMMIIVQV